MKGQMGTRRRGVCRKGNEGSQVWNSPIAVSGGEATWGSPLISGLHGEMSWR